MKNVTLEGANMTSREAFHDEAAAKFGFPEWYGRNLDAMWDLLTEPDEGWAIILNDPQLIPEPILTGVVSLFLDLARSGANSFEVTSSRAVAGERYRHFKGGEYVVEGLAFDCETLEVTVVYRRANAAALWTRALGNWCESVEYAGKVIKRFTVIDG